ncbi:unnamed protein product [Somion occarium]|uniref:CUB domain-containing protein n=1 Tax=Somion occarium TaxID=3059160 RepID=A0ABP1CRJ4_9APHY
MASCGGRVLYERTWCRNSNSRECHQKTELRCYWFIQRLVISGAKDPAAGTVQIQVDQTNYTENLFSTSSSCGVFFDQSLPEDAHSYILTLIPQNRTNSSSSPPELHLREIAFYYYASVDNPSSSSSPLSTGGIIAVSVACSLVGVVILIWVFTYLRRRKDRTSPSSGSENQADEEVMLVVPEQRDDGGMTEHRTLTSLSYGLSQHVASDAPRITASSTINPFSPPPSYTPDNLAPPSYEGQRF